MPTLRVVIEGEGDVTSEPAGIELTGPGQASMETTDRLVLLTGEPADGWEMDDWKGFVIKRKNAALAILWGVETTVLARFRERHVPQPDIAVSPLGLDFGLLTVGREAQQSVAVGNRGDAPCQVTVKPSGSRDFQASPLELVVPPGESRGITVRYRPSDVGNDVGSLDLESNDPDTPSVSVSLTGEGQGRDDGGDGGGIIETPDGAPLRWLHTDVSSWPETVRLSRVRTGSLEQTLDYDVATARARWPRHPENVYGNPWLIAKVGDTWFAATWEWLRPGQTRKRVAARGPAGLGAHTKRHPLTRWEPRAGEPVGWLVSGLARDRKRSARERTNVVWQPWSE